MKSIDLEEQQVLNLLEKFYSEKIENIMDSDPNSYTLTPCWFSNDTSKKVRSIKREYLPHICERMAKFLREKIPYDFILENYDSLEHHILGNIRHKKNELLEMAYGDKYIPLYDHIQMAPLHFVEFERFTEEETKIIYKGMISNLEKPFDNEKFHVDIIHANNQFGMSDNNGYNQIFNVRRFSDKTMEYVDHKANQVWMDARLGLMFYYKNKPAFFISFFIDFERNIYIRQIQGLRKGRGHYVLGDEWQKKVVNFVKERFSFANSVNIITEDSAFEYLQRNYAENHVREAVIPTLKKASEMYSMFHNLDVRELDITLNVSFSNQIKLHEKYYTI